MSETRVLLVEDHGLVRAGLRELLAKVPGVRVVGEVGDGVEVIDAVEQLHPDLVLMDISLPHVNGLELTAQIGPRFPHTRVLVLSMHRNEEYVLKALQAGAAGYLLKDADTTELELAVRSVCRNQTYLSPAVSRPVIDHYLAATGTGEPLDILTSRQRQVLQLIAEGYTTNQIAQLLAVSPKTVETHRMHLMERLQAHSVAELVRYAIGQGLVWLDR